MVDILKEAQLMVNSSNPTTISTFTTFEELGYDSLDILEFVAKLEEKFGVTICDGEDAVKSIGELVAKFDKLLKSKTTSGQYD